MGSESSSVIGRLLFVDYGCKFILDDLLDISIRRGFKPEHLDLSFTYRLKPSLRIRFYIDVLAELRKGNYRGIVLCSPVFSRLIFWLILLLILPYRRVVILIPPSLKHKRRLLTITYSMITSFLMLIHRIKGVSFLVIYTTPYEKQLFEQIIYGNAEAYYPAYTFKRRFRPPSFIRVNPPLLFIYGLNEYAVKWIPGMIVFLEELGVKPLLVIGLEEPIGKCLQLPIGMCVHSSDYEWIIREATIVIVLHPSPWSNLILSKAISHGRPVLADPSVGMGHVYRDTGLVVFEDYANPETIATKILKILNEIDKYKQIGLRVEVIPPKPSYFIEVFEDFLKY